MLSGPHNCGCIALGPEASQRGARGRGFSRVTAPAQWWMRHQHQPLLRALVETWTAPAQWPSWPFPIAPSPRAGEWCVCPSNSWPTPPAGDEDHNDDDAYVNAAVLIVIVL